MSETLYDHCLRMGKAALLSQWDASNAPLTPQRIASGSDRLVWWHCDKGHTWQQSPHRRTYYDAGCPYCSNRRVLAGYNDLASADPELTKQWDFNKNSPLLPTQVSPGSHKKVWWRCEKGHEWCAVIKSRTAGCGCPICKNHTVAAGENSLADQYPDLCREWDHEKNAPLSPEQVLPGTTRKVWWRCTRGHTWNANINSRTKGSGCPYCAGTRVIPGETDLRTQFPEIVAQWDQEKNGMMRPEKISPYSNRKAWWTCEKGHSYYMGIAQRTHSGRNCPYCTGKKVLPGFNDLATLYPAVSAQWDPDRNGALTPNQVMASGGNRVWWICEKGHSYSAVISSRTSGGCGCPYCSGNKVLPGFNDLATRDPIVAAQWNDELNGTLTPDQVTSGSARRVWWRCAFGHQWRTAVCHRTGSRRTGCPVCAKHTVHSTIVW